MNNATAATNDAVGTAWFTVQVTDANAGNTSVKVRFHDHTGNA